jgi:hypothetical protein
MFRNAGLRGNYWEKRKRTARSIARQAVNARFLLAGRAEEHLPYVIDDLSFAIARECSMTCNASTQLRSETMANDKSSMT